METQPFPFKCCCSICSPKLSKQQGCEVLSESVLMRCRRDAGRPLSASMWSELSHSLASPSGLRIQKRKTSTLCVLLSPRGNSSHMFSSGLLQFQFLPKVKMQKSPDTFMMSRPSRRCVTASYSPQTGLFVCLQDASL